MARLNRMNMTKQFNLSIATSVLFLLLVSFAVFPTPARSADNQEAIMRAIFSPGPKPPPLLAPPNPTPDEVFILDSSYPRSADTNGLFATFDQLREDVATIQARVYATNQFLAKLHNCRSKLMTWYRSYGEEKAKLAVFFGEEASTPSNTTNRMRYHLIRTLMLPVFCLELMDDPNYAEFITEAVRIQLDPPVPAYPPCMYMVDGLLGLPSATNTALRLPVSPPPSSLAIRRELEARVPLVEPLAKGMGPCEDFPVSALPAIKVGVMVDLLGHMVELCKRVDYPKDLRDKLDEARKIRGRLPRGPLTDTK